MKDRWSDPGAVDVSGADTSSLTEQLQRGFHGLRFEGELESAYRRDQFHDRLRYLRINLALLAVISLVVVQVDRVVIPMHRAHRSRPRPDRHHAAASAGGLRDDIRPREPTPGTRATSPSR